MYYTKQDINLILAKRNSLCRSILQLGCLLPTQNFLTRSGLNPVIRNSGFIFCKSINWKSLDIPKAPYANAPWRL